MPEEDNLLARIEDIRQMVAEAGKDFKLLRIEVSEISGELKGKLHEPGHCAELAVLAVSLNEVKQAQSQNRGFIVGVIATSALLAAGGSAAAIKLMGL